MLKASKLLTLAFDNLLYMSLIPEIDDLANLLFPDLAVCYPKILVPLETGDYKPPFPATRPILRFGIVGLFAAFFLVLSTVIFVTLALTIPSTLELDLGLVAPAVLFADVFTSF